MILTIQKLLVAAAIIAIFIWLYKQDIAEYKKDPLACILASFTALLITIVILLMFFY